MTGHRMIARFTKGRGWTYNIGGEVGFGPKIAQDLLIHVYGLRGCEAREKLAHARNGSVVSLGEPLRPAREEVNA